MLKWANMSEFYTKIFYNVGYELLIHNRIILTFI